LLDSAAVGFQAVLTKCDKLAAAALDSTVAAVEGALADGRRLFAQACAFVAGAARRDQLPRETLPEVAFAGRSNVGKSSLINALTGQRTLARTSRTPGRTRQINFFDLGGQLMLVDLPGYGFSRAPKGEVRAWTALVGDYLRGRPGLRRVCLLVDSRHGPKESDREVMRLLDSAAVGFQAVLTKCDKLAAAALDSTVAAVEGALAGRGGGRARGAPGGLSRGARHQRAHGLGNRRPARGAGVVGRGPAAALECAP
jgi:GTP-binding protein